MRIENFNVKIEGNASSNFNIYILNGGVTQLPTFEYTNKHDYNVILQPSLPEQSVNYLGNSVFIIPTNYFVKPNETVTIQLQLFRGYHPNKIFFSVSAFLVTMTEVILDDVAQTAIIEKIIEKEIPENPETKNNNISNCIIEDKKFIHKYFGEFGKRGKLYKKWVDDGRPMKNDEPVLDPNLAAFNH